MSFIILMQEFSSINLIDINRNLVKDNISMTILKLTYDSIKYNYQYNYCQTVYGLGVP